MPYEGFTFSVGGNVTTIYSTAGRLAADPLYLDKIDITYPYPNLESGKIELLTERFGLLRSSASASNGDQVFTDYPELKNVLAQKWAEVLSNPAWRGLENSAPAYKKVFKVGSHTDECPVSQLMHVEVIQLSPTEITQWWYGSKFAKYGMVQLGHEFLTQAYWVNNLKNQFKLVDNDFDGFAITVNQGFIMRVTTFQSSLIPALKYDNGSGVSGTWPPYKVFCN